MGGGNKVSPLQESEFDRIWKMYTEFGVTERHFNDLQARYRALASTWLLATFAGIGFVTTQETLGEFFSPLLLASGIGVMGSIGITLLWVLDLMVYHRLLNAAFIEGLNLEGRHLELPAIRHNMMHYTGPKGVLPRVVFFYSVGGVVPLAVSAITLVSWTRNCGEDCPTRLASLGIVAIGAAIAGLLLTIHTTTPMGELYEERWRYRRPKAIELFEALKRRLANDGLTFQDWLAERITERAPDDKRPYQEWLTERIEEYVKGEKASGVS